MARAIVPPGVPSAVSPGEDQRNQHQRYTALLGTRDQMVVALLGLRIPVRNLASAFPD